MVSLILHSVSVSLQSSAQTLNWAKCLGGTYSDRGHDLVIDRFGHTIITGQEDPHDSIEQVVLAKYDESGTLIWKKNFGGALMDKKKSVDVDQQGNIVVAGTFCLTADFDPSPAVHNLTSASPYYWLNNAFIAKYDSSGNYICSSAITNNADVTVTDVKFDSLGNIYIAGLSNTNADFDPGVGVTHMTEGSAFLAKYDPNGNFLWVKGLGAGGTLYIKAFDIDKSGDIYLTGSLAGFVDFNPTTSTFYIVSGWNGEGSNIFLAKYTASGGFVWAKSFNTGGATSDDMTANDLVIDQSGNLLVTGFFRDSIDFDPGPDFYILTGTKDLSPCGSAFLGKYSSDGSLIWVFGLEVNYRTEGTAVTTDESGNVYYCGWYVGSPDLDPGSAVFTPPFSLSTPRGFLSKIPPSGAFINAIYISNGAASPIGQAIAIDTARNISVIGSFAGTVNFNPDGNTSLTSAGDIDIFTVHYDQCLTTAYDTAYICNGAFYHFPNGDSASVSINHLSSFITNDGCDSLIRTALITPDLDLEVVLIDSTLTVGEDGATYQWMDCSDGYALVLNETNQNYTLTNDHYYAVAVTREFCTDTSLCSGFLNLAPQRPAPQYHLELYPNPNDGRMSIEYSINKKDCAVFVLYDLTGKALERYILKPQQNSLQLNVPFLNKGVYYGSLMVNEMLVLTKKIVVL